MKTRHDLSQRGYTITELMISIAVLAVMVAIGLPSFQSMLANYRVRSAADALASSVMYARTEAIKRNQTMQLTSVGGDWSNGWNITAQGSNIVISGEALSDVVVSGMTVSSFEIGKDGRIGANHTASVCDTHNLASTREIVITFAGMTRVNKGERCGS